MTRPASPIPPTGCQVATPGATGTDLMSPQQLRVEKLEIAVTKYRAAVLRRASRHDDFRKIWIRYAELQAELDRERRALRESGA